MARVLVVEDEPGIALGLEDSLRLEGYEVEVVNNGASASRRALEEAFGAGGMPIGATKDWDS